MTDEIKRMRYFDGLFLTEEEFNLEQDYHNRLRRLHNRHLHSWGIVWGMDVVHGPGSKEVTVKEGMSLNRVLVSGEEVSQEIILTSNTSVDLSGYAAEDSVYIYISYFEEAVDIKEERGGTEKIHWQENAVLGHSKTRPQNENENIILAKVVLKPEDGTIDANSITYEEDGISLRTYAGFSGKLLEVQKLIFGIDGVTSNLASMEGKIINTENGIQVDSPRTNFKGDLDVAGILTGNLADDIIGTNQIVNNAVNAAKIANGSIVDTKLADNSVNDKKIVDGSVGNKELADNSVNAAKIADGSVGTIELADNAVNSDKLQSHTADDNLRAVNTGHIKDSAVTEAKLEQSIKDKLATVVPSELIQEIEDARGIKEKLGNRLNESLTAGGQLRKYVVGEDQLDTVLMSKIGRPAGWLRMTFFPKNILDFPVFTIRSFYSECDSRGAAGTMEIPVPPGATKIKSFRIHGNANVGSIEIYIGRSFWNGTTSLGEYLSRQKIEGAPFNEIWLIDTPIDPETDSINLTVQAASTARIYTVAFEFE